LDDGAEENNGLRRIQKRRAVLVVSDEEGLCDDEIDDVSTHCRPGDMPSYIPLGAPLKARYTAQDLAPGFMKAVVAGVRDINFVRWYCDTAEGVGCFQNAFLTLILYSAPSVYRKISNADTLFLRIFLNANCDAFHAGMVAVWIVAGSRT
jgi:hypothetical protein